MPMRQRTEVQEMPREGGVKQRMVGHKAIPGSGRFRFNNGLVLTKEGNSRPKWDLPDCFKESEISYHKHPWKDVYFKSTERGQEFVIKDDKK